MSRFTSQASGALLVLAALVPTIFGQNAEKPVAYSPSAKYVAGTVYAGAKLKKPAPENTIWVFERLPKELKLVKRFEGHAGEVTALHWAPDGKSLVSGSADGEAILWTWKDGKARFRWKGEHAVAKVSVSADSKTVLVVRTANAAPKAASPGTLTFIDSEAGTAIGSMPLEDRVESLAVALKGSTGLVCQANRVNHFLNLAKGEPYQSFTAAGKVEFAVFAPGGKKAYTLANEGKVVQIWDVATAKEVQRIAPEKHHLVSLAFSRDGKKLMGLGVENFTAYRRSPLDSVDAAPRVLLGLFTLGISELVAGIGVNQVSAQIQTVYVWDASTGISVYRGAVNPTTAQKLQEWGFGNAK